MKVTIKTCKLGDCVELIMGQAPPSNDTNFQGIGTPFVKVGEFGKIRPAIREWTTNPLRMAQKKDVLLCVVGATCGKINLGEDCAIGRSVAAIRPQPSRLDQYYLYYFMKTLVERLRAGSLGAAQTVISKDMVQEIKIPLPELAEQKRIVALLDKAFEALATAKANAEQNLQNARALFESHLESVFSQRGEEWVDANLDEVVTHDCSLSYGIVQPGEEVDNGLPVVRPTDLTRDEISLDGLKRIDPVRASSYQRTTLHGNELLLCVRGSTGVLAKAAPELAGANVTRGIVPIRLGSQVLTNGFGFHLLRSQIVQEQIREKTYGTALMQINISDLRKVKLAFPPIGEQHVLAAQLDEVSLEAQRLTSIYERKLAALEELKTSLLHQAFNGEL